MSIVDYVLRLGTLVDEDTQDIIDTKYNEIFVKILDKLSEHVHISISHRVPYSLYDDNIDLLGYLEAKTDIVRKITQKYDIILTPDTYPVLAQQDQRILNICCSGMYRGISDRKGPVFIIRGMHHMCCFCIYDNILYHFDSSYTGDNRIYLESFLICHPDLIGMPVHRVFEYNFQEEGDREGYNDVYCRLWTTYFIYSIYVKGVHPEKAVYLLEKDRISCMKELLMYVI